MDFLKKYVWWLPFVIRHKIINLDKALRISVFMACYMNTQCVLWRNACIRDTQKLLAILYFLCQEGLQIISIKDNNEKHMDDLKGINSTNLWYLNATKQIDEWCRIWKAVLSSAFFSISYCHSLSYLQLIFTKHICSFPLVFFCRFWVFVCFGWFTWKSPPKWGNVTKH